MNITLWCLKDHRGNWGILLGHKKGPSIWCHVTSLYGVLTDLSVFTSNAGKNRIGRTNLQFQFGSRDIVPRVKKDKVSRDSWLLVYLRKHAPAPPPSIPCRAPSGGQYRLHLKAPRQSLGIYLLARHLPRFLAARAFHTLNIFALQGFKLQGWHHSCWTFIILPRYIPAFCHAFVQSKPHLPAEVTYFGRESRVFT